MNDAILKSIPAAFEARRDATGAILVFSEDKAILRFYPLSELSGEGEYLAVTSLTSQFADEDEDYYVLIFRWSEGTSERDIRFDLVSHAVMASGSPALLGEMTFRGTPHRFCWNNVAEGEHEYDEGDVPSVPDGESGDILTLLANHLNRTEPPEYHACVFVGGVSTGPELFQVCWREPLSYGKYKDITFDSFSDTQMNCHSLLSIDGTAATLILVNETLDPWKGEPKRFVDAVASLKQWLRPYPFDAMYGMQTCHWIW